MSEKDIEIWWYEVNKNEFHASKQPIILDLVNTDKTVVSHKFKHSDKNSKYFVDYENDDIMHRFASNQRIHKYFGNGGKICLLKLEW